MDTMAIARYGMMAASQRLNASAARIAGGGDVDLASEATEIIGARQAFKAQVQVAKIADEMWDALLGLQTQHA